MLKALFFVVLLVSQAWSVKAIDMAACESLWMQMARDRANYWMPSGLDMDIHSPGRPKGLHIISFGQPALSNPKQVDQIKSDMLAGKFDYKDSRFSMDGDYHAPSRTIVVGEGHHRFNAALEIAFETQDWSHFKQLVANSPWRYTHKISSTARQLPLRKRATFFTKWRSFVKSLSPPSALRNK